MLGAPELDAVATLVLNIQEITSTVCNLVWNGLAHQGQLDYVY